jgi:glycosyltransferase involved in cell wall biosynthesis
MSQGNRIDSSHSANGSPHLPLVSVVLPCLNEANTVGRCVQKALASLESCGIAGEVVVSDNGSTDGSAALAEAAGARVVYCSQRGYGTAIQYGVQNARGRIVVMADADDSYDLEHLGPFVRPLLAGDCDVVMGNRFRGGIEPGAMPWKNRWIGNPVLTGILRLFFGGTVRDAHCGLRAFTHDAYDRMKPAQAGMEFASELVVQAIRLKLRIKEEPTKLFVDGRNRRPHLRPWRDACRHLTYLICARFWTCSPCGAIVPQHDSNHKKDSVVSSLIQPK